MEKSKDTRPVQEQFPGQNFSPGNITLFQIAESRGKNIGQNQSPAEATISDRDKAILEKAIPTDRFERVLKSVATKIEVGSVMMHKPTGKHVKIVKLNVGKSGHGAIQHLIKVEGTSIKCKVKGDNLCPI